MQLALSTHLDLDVFDFANHRRLGQRKSDRLGWLVGHIDFDRVDGVWRRGHIILVNRDIYIYIYNSLLRIYKQVLTADTAFIAGGCLQAAKPGQSLPAL